MYVEHLTWCTVHGKQSINDSYYTIIITIFLLQLLKCQASRHKILDISFLLYWSGMASWKNEATWYQFQEVPLALIQLCTQGERALFQNTVFATKYVLGTICHWCLKDNLATAVTM